MNSQGDDEQKSDGCQFDKFKYGMFWHSSRSLDYPELVSHFGCDLIQDVGQN